MLLSCYLPVLQFSACSRIFNSHLRIKYDAAGDLIVKKVVAMGTFVYLLTIKKFSNIFNSYLLKEFVLKCYNSMNSGENERY